jgi:hypothetical protein
MQEPSGPSHERAARIQRQLALLAELRWGAERAQALDVELAATAEMLGRLEGVRLAPDAADPFLTSE